MLSVPLSWIASVAQMAQVPPGFRRRRVKEPGAFRRWVGQTRRRCEAMERLGGVDMRSLTAPSALLTGRRCRGRPARWGEHSIGVSVRLVVEIEQLCALTLRPCALWADRAGYFSSVAAQRGPRRLFPGPCPRGPPLEFIPIDAFGRQRFGDRWLVSKIFLRDAGAAADRADIGVTGSRVASFRWRPTKNRELGSDFSRRRTSSRSGGLASYRGT